MTVNMCHFLPYLKTSSSFPEEALISGFVCPTVEIIQIQLLEEGRQGYQVPVTDVLSFFYIIIHLFIIQSPKSE